MGRGSDSSSSASSSSSSIDSSSHPTAAATANCSDHHHHHVLSSASSSSSSSSSKQQRDLLITDLRLGLSLSSSSSSLLHQHEHHNSSSRDDEQKGAAGWDWPPIKPLLRRTLKAGKQNRPNINNNQLIPTLFVKVYMEGIPIGRKVDLFTLHAYDALIRTLAHMFSTPILYPGGADQIHYDDDHHHHRRVLTYEDKEGDWMMVGDVPWDMFLTTVKRLKITRTDQYC